MLESYKLVFPKYIQWNDSPTVNEPCQKRVYENMDLLNSEYHLVLKTHNVLFCTQGSKKLDTYLTLFIPVIPRFIWPQSPLLNNTNSHPAEQSLRNAVLATWCCEPLHRHYLLSQPLSLFLQHVGDIISFGGVLRMPLPFFLKV